MAAGTRGSSVKRRYQMDSGVFIIIKVPKYLADVADAGLTPVAGGEERRPFRFRPRVAFWEATLPAAGGLPERVIRRSIPFNPSADIISDLTSREKAVDGIAGMITGYRGEKRTYE